LIVGNAVKRCWRWGVVGGFGLVCSCCEIRVTLVLFKSFWGAVVEAARGVDGPCFCCWVSYSAHFSNRSFTN